MTAKLARIQQQEQEMMEKWQNGTGTKSKKVGSDAENVRRVKKKKKKLGNDDGSCENLLGNVNLSSIETPHPDENLEKSKKKKKSSRKSDSCDVLLNYSTPDCLEAAQAEPISKKRKKDKKRLCVEGENDQSGEIPCDQSMTVCSVDEVVSKLNKKKNKFLSSKVVSENHEQVHSETVEECALEKPKKKKKKSKDIEKENKVDVGRELEVLENEIGKKQKKKKRERTEAGLVEDVSQDNTVCEISDSLTENSYKKKKKKSKREKQNL